MSVDPATQWVLLEYDVDDGEAYETHRWIVPSTVRLGEVIEMVDSNTIINRESVRILSIGVWE